MCSYDTVRVSPGADDDGSGVAAVLMLAEIMSQYSFNATIRFILFSGEEQGLLGSRSYAQKTIELGEKIIGVLALDKIGYAVTSEDGNKIRHHANPRSGWMIDISEELVLQYPEPLSFEVVRLPFDPSSDHKAFTDLGIAGSNLVEETLSPVYHTSEDRIEYMNMTYLTKVCQLALGIVATIATLDPVLDDDDVAITIQGSVKAKPVLLQVGVENKHPENDTINATITIEMTHLLRKTFVSTIKDYYTTPCTWNFTKEIDDIWVFQVIGRKFTRGLFKITVTVRGQDDDITLYAQQQTLGVIIRSFKILLKPCL
jgi:hypothetical protein